MPKIAANIVQQVEESEATAGFELVDPGQYLGRLAKVDAREKDGKVSWSAEFDEIHTLDGEKVPGRQWLNLNMPIGAIGDPAPSWYQKDQKAWNTYQRMSNGQLKAFFEAFGYTADSDTDEMLGEWAVLVIGIATIQAGARQGEKTNRVNGIKPVDDSVEIPEVEALDDDTY